MPVSEQIYSLETNQLPFSRRLHEFSSKSVFLFIPRIGKTAVFLLIISWSIDNLFYLTNTKWGCKIQQI